MRTSSPKLSTLSIKRVAMLTGPLLALGLLFTTSAEARGRHQKLTPEQRQERFEMHKTKLAEKVRTKLAPRLKLDDATTAQLVTILQDGMTERHVAKQKVHTQRKALRELVKSGADDATLDTAIANLRRSMEAMPKHDAIFDDVARILTPTQQAKFILASHKILKPHHKRHGKRGKRGKRGGDFEGKAAKAQDTF